ncbi:HemK2/MTQ2 family protein methyltransferase [Amycolatopsis arida]|uniref:HemK2/MTQ2 family protein methyltransferase n=1 Tax=Amycolatopsis arida TaxID=587909 RepID=UPI000B869A17|nr:HemK2/MTQ2 family protein methyltransferase [Amycolatopsis arida]
MLMLRLPGVYRPQADTWLLSKAVREAGLRPGAQVLDLCTGTGAVAFAAARAGAGAITAVDTARRAVLAAWLNTRLRRLPVRVRRADVRHLPQLPRFDLVVANPPYVPGDPARGPTRRAERAWDAGPDGRRFVDRLCAAAPELLAEGGALLLVHSSLCGEQATLDRLRAERLKASVVARRVEPFGPVLRGRVGYLERAGLIEPGQCHEELVVIRADRLPLPPEHERG